MDSRMKLAKAGVSCRCEGGRLRKQRAEDNSSPASDNTLALQQSACMGRRGHVR